MKNFWTGSGQFQTLLRFGFDPGTNVFGFCYVFWYHSDSVTNRTKKMVHDREGTKRCPVLYGSKIWVILCVIVGKINNMMLCKIHVNMCLRDVLTWKL